MRPRGQETLRTTRHRRQLSMRSSLQLRQTQLRLLQPCSAAAAHSGLAREQKRARPTVRAIWTLGIRHCRRCLASVGGLSSLGLRRAVPLQHLRQLLQPLPLQKTMLQHSWAVGGEEQVRGGDRRIAVASHPAAAAPRPMGLQWSLPQLLSLFQSQPRRRPHQRQPRHPHVQQWTLHQAHHPSWPWLPRRRQRQCQRQRQDQRRRQRQRQPPMLMLSPCRPSHLA
mmetsp:Transcript_29093/g.94878  ORF Transcript_29093/g.94878 Transcript_29093/m.94878 type:complete len:225 (-) Transcript_29093:189-863(-)